MFTQQLPLNRQIEQCQLALAQHSAKRRELEQQLRQRWQTPVLALAGIWAGSAVAAHVTAAATAPPTTPDYARYCAATPATALCSAACQMLLPAGLPVGSATLPAVAPQLSGIALWLAWYNKPLWWWELWRWLRSHRPRPPSKTPTIAQPPH